MVPLIATEQHNGDKAFDCFCRDFLVIEHETKKTAISTLCTSLVHKYKLNSDRTLIIPQSSKTNLALLLT